MTLPYERTRAVNFGREFLLELINPQKTPRIPKAIRKQAHDILRHYPSEVDMEVISRREDMAIQQIYRIFGDEQSWMKNLDK